MSKSLAKPEAGALTIAPGDRQLEALKQIAGQATPEKEIRWRPGRGGARLPYTDGAYVVRTLNDAFGFDWDFETDNEELLMNGSKPFEVKVRGKLTVRLRGQAVTKMQFGCQPIEFLKNGEAPVSIGDCYKGAATDALKKCASLLGVALDLYDSDSQIHASSSGNQTRSQQQQNGQQVDSTDFWKQAKAASVPTAEAAKIANRAAAKEITWAEAINQLESKGADKQ